MKILYILGCVKKINFKIWASEPCKTQKPPGLSVFVIFCWQKYKLFCIEILKHHSLDLYQHLGILFRFFETLNFTNNQKRALGSLSFKVTLTNVPRSFSHRNLYKLPKRIWDVGIYVRWYNLQSKFIAPANSDAWICKQAKMNLFWIFVHKMILQVFFKYRCI
jgi:hypothetical protein